MFLRGTLIFLLIGSSALAVDTTWTGAVDNDVANAGNWSDGVPASFADNAIVDGGSNLPIIIPDGIGTLELGGFQLGTSGATGGHVVQNGGTLVISADFKSHVGDQGTLDSSWIMNGNSVMLYDERKAAPALAMDPMATVRTLKSAHKPVQEAESVGWNCTTMPFSESQMI